MKTLNSSPMRWVPACAGMILVLGLTTAQGAGAAEMNDTASNEAIKGAVLQGSGWKAEDLEIESDPLLKATASCRLLVGRNKRIPGAGLMRVALDGEGKVLARTGDLTGLTRVLHECVQPDAMAWAQTVAVYTNALAPKVVKGNDAIEMKALKAAGAVDVPPSLKQMDGGNELRFVMALPVSRYFRVTAFVPTSGATRVDLQDIQTR